MKKTIREIPLTVRLDPPQGETVRVYKVELWGIPCPCGVMELVPGDDPPEVYTCLACGRQNTIDARPVDE